MNQIPLDMYLYLQQQQANMNSTPLFNPAEILHLNTGYGTIVNQLLEENQQLRQNLAQLLTENEPKLNRNFQDVSIFHNQNYNFQPTESSISTQVPYQEELNFPPIKLEVIVSPLPTENAANYIGSALLSEENRIELNQIIKKNSEEEKANVEPQIQRRGGFKASLKNKKQRKYPSPVSKQLWITFGRHIIDHAIRNMEGEDQERVKKLKDKLNTKRAYAEIFMVKSTDAPEEIAFKKRFGKSAIEFVEKESSGAFLSSNYRKELIAEKGKVARWIRSFAK